MRSRNLIFVIVFRDLGRFLAAFGREAIRSVSSTRPDLPDSSFIYFTPTRTPCNTPDSQADISNAMDHDEVATEGVVIELQSATSKIKKVHWYDQNDGKTDDQDHHAQSDAQERCSDGFLKSKKDAVVRVISNAFNRIKMRRNGHVEVSSNETARDDEVPNVEEFADNQNVGEMVEEQPIPKPRKSKVQELNYSEMLRSSVHGNTVTVGNESPVLVKSDNHSDASLPLEHLTKEPTAQNSLKPKIFGKIKAIGDVFSKFKKTNEESMMVPNDETSKAQPIDELGNAQDEIIETVQEFLNRTAAELPPIPKPRKSKAAAFFGHQKAQPIDELRNAQDEIIETIEEFINRTAAELPPIPKPRKSKAAAFFGHEKAQPIDELRNAQDEIIETIEEFINRTAAELPPIPKPRKSKAAAFFGHEQAQPIDELRNAQHEIIETVEEFINRTATEVPPIPKPRKSKAAAFFCHEQAKPIDELRNAQYEIIETVEEFINRTAAEVPPVPKPRKSKAAAFFGHEQVSGAAIQKNPTSVGQGSSFYAECDDICDSSSPVDAKPKKSGFAKTVDNVFSKLKGKKREPSVDSIEGNSHNQ